MAKDSFILYTEQKETINKLSDEQAGKLFKAIYEYEATGIMPELEKEIDLVMTPIKLTLDKNEEKWNEAKRKRSEAGKKGMAVRWNNKNNNVITDITKDNNVKSVITDITKITVNDNVNVNDNIKENIKRKKFVAPTLEEINQYITEKKLQVDGQKFFEYFEEGGWKDSKGNQVKNWKQKLLTWNKYSQPSVNKKQTYEQRDYDNLDFLYKNKN